MAKQFRSQKVQTVRSATLQTYLLVQLLLAALLPTGFMPSFGGNELSIVICTPEGLKQVVDTTAPKDGEQDHLDHCIWQGRDITYPPLFSIPVDFAALRADRAIRIAIDTPHYLSEGRPYFSRAPPQAA